MDIDKISNILNTGFIGRNIIYLKRIDSTNDFAIDLIKERRKAKKLIDLEKISGTLIISELQDKGRGRLGRKWFSPAGGLWFTLILICGLELKDLQKITLVSALAVSEVLNTRYDIKIKIKWPNDIYYESYKLGGILVESEKIDKKIALVLGFGLNVNFKTDKLIFKDEKNILKDDRKEKNKTNIKSLKEITGRNLDREKLICRILESFEKYYLTYISKKEFGNIFKKIEKYLVY
jgi:BirA family biotin operon repressor/biotin-[acetyl-CoA-carboxylase] ligase